MRKPLTPRAIRRGAGAAPATTAPIGGEIAASIEGRDITLPFIGALREVQDTVLRRLGSQNYEVYRELRRDGQVHATFQQRRLALKSRPLIVEPGGEAPIDIEAADWLRKNLEQISFDRASGLMMWGSFYGYGVSECMFAHRDGRIWLDGLRGRTPWRFRFGWQGELRLLTQTQRLEGELMPPRKFWTTSWGADNDDDPYGLGLAHQLYWPVFFKKQGLGFWLRALEKFGAPSVLGKYPSGSDRKVINELLSALQKLRLDGVLAIPEGTTAELLEASRGTMDQAAFNRAMNAEITKIVLGQTMTTDDGASLSQSEVHMEVREELVDADAEELCESFQTGPATWLTEWNFPGAAIPVIRRPAPEDEERKAKLISAKADAVKAMADAGYEPTPETEDELFGGGWVRIKTPTSPRAEPVPPPLLGGSAFAEGHDHPPDAVDAYVEEMEWAPLMEEPIAFLERWLSDQPDLETARDALPALVASLPVDRLRLALSQSMFEAVASGRAGLSLVDDDMIETGGA